MLHSSQEGVAGVTVRQMVIIAQCEVGCIFGGASVGDVVEREGEGEGAIED